MSDSNESKTISKRKMNVATYNAFIEIIAFVSIEAPTWSVYFITLESKSMLVEKLLCYKSEQRTIEIWREREKKMELFDGLGLCYGNRSMLQARFMNDMQTN